MPILSEKDNYFKEEITLDDGSSIKREEFWKEATKEESKTKEWFEEILKKKRIAIIDEGILTRNETFNADIKEKGEAETTFVATKILSTQSEIELSNTAEIIKIDKTGGSRITKETSIITDEAEQVIVTPPTGANKDYKYLGTIIVALITITGVVIAVNKRNKNNIDLR